MFFKWFYTGRSHILARVMRMKIEKIDWGIISFNWVKIEILESKNTLLKVMAKTLLIIQKNGSYECYTLCNTSVCYDYCCTHCSLKFRVENVYLFLFIFLISIYFFIYYFSLQKMVCSSLWKLHKKSQSFVLSNQQQLPL